jgi:hypothetical protein
LRRRPPRGRVELLSLCWDVVCGFLRGIDGAKRQSMRPAGNRAGELSLMRRVWYHKTIASYYCCFLLLAAGKKEKAIKYIVITTAYSGVQMVRSYRRHYLYSGDMYLLFTNSCIHVFTFDYE